MTALQTKHPKVRVVLPYVGPMEATAVRWLAPDPALKQKFDELDDVKDELANHLPFGRVGRECLLVENKAPYPVSIFMEKLWPLAPSLKVFFDEVVLRPGDKTPMQRLASVRKEGLKLEKQKKPAAAAALLAPLLAAFNSDPDPKRQYTEDHEEHVADAWNSLGVFTRTPVTSPLRDQPSNTLLGGAWHSAPRIIARAPALMICQLASTFSRGTSRPASAPSATKKRRTCAQCW